MPNGATGNSRNSPVPSMSCIVIESCTSVTHSISRNGEAASFEKPVKILRFFFGVSSALRRISVVPPIENLSPISISAGSVISRPRTRVPRCEPVSQTNQPSSRRISTAWSRETDSSGIWMSQLRLRPIEFSQYSTGKCVPVAASSSMMTGSLRRWPFLKEVYERQMTYSAMIGVTALTASRNVDKRLEFNTRTRMLCIVSSISGSSLSRGSRRSPRRAYRC